MPTYLYKCPDCRTPATIFKKLAQLNRIELCGHCESLKPMERQVTAPAVAGDFAAYDCPITGDRIEGRKAHEANLKKHGCRVLEPGETEALKRRRASDEAQFDADVGATVDEFISTASVEKREALAIAEQSGMDVSLTRSTPTF